MSEGTQEEQTNVGKHQPTANCRPCGVALCAKMIELETLLLVETLEANEPIDSTLQTKDESFTV